MEDVPEPWLPYSDMQNALDRRRTVDDLTWGLEAGLNRLLEGEPAAQAARYARSTSRRERSQLQQRLAAAPHDDGVRDDGAATDALDAHRSLLHLKQAAGRANWRLLVAVADGFQFEELATRLGTTPGALRVKVFRLRRALKPLVARVLDQLVP